MTVGVTETMGQSVTRKCLVVKAVWLIGDCDRRKCETPECARARVREGGDGASDDWGQMSRSLCAEALVWSWGAGAGFSRSLLEIRRPLLDLLHPLFELPRPLLDFSIPAWGFFALHVLCMDCEIIGSTSVETEGKGVSFLHNFCSVRPASLLLPTMREGEKRGAAKGRVSVGAGRTSRHKKGEPGAVGGAGSPVSGRTGRISCPPAEILGAATLGAAPRRGRCSRQRCSGCR